MAPILPSSRYFRAGGQIAESAIDAWGAGRKADKVLDAGKIATETNWENSKTLVDHFKRHGSDFGSQSAKGYAEQASEFFKNSQKNGSLTKIDSDGTIRVYDPNTNTFGSYNPDETTKTFFKPDPSKHGYKTNLEYWENQKGKLIK